MPSDVYYHAVDSDTDLEEIKRITKQLLHTLIEEEGITLRREIPLKVHFGEKGNVTFLKPENFDGIIDYLQERDIESCFIETSVLYGGKRFKKELDERMFGKELVKLLGAKTLRKMAAKGKLISFLKKKKFKGQPLIEKLDGWMKAALPLRGLKVINYHKNWTYFSARFGTECAMYVEPQPGIPPSPGHVRDVVEFIEAEDIQVLLAANYFRRSQVEQVASRTGATPVVVPEHVEGEEGVNDYFELIDTWIARISAAYGVE